MAELRSQRMRRLNPEMDPLRLGMGWSKEDLAKPHVLIESVGGDSHPGSAHLVHLVERVREGILEAGALRRGTSAPTSATASPRGPRGCGIPWPLGR